jgi:hypothetical protein
MGKELAEKLPEAGDEAAAEVEDETSGLEAERVEETLDEILGVEMELLLLFFVDIDVGVDLLLVTLDGLAIAFCDVDFVDDVEGFDAGNCLLEVLVFLLEVELLIETELLVEDDALDELETCFNVVLTEDVGEVVFLVEEVILMVDDEIFLRLVVFFAAATEEDETEAWIHLQALLTWATDSPLTLDFVFLLESHDLQ